MRTNRNRLRLLTFFVIVGAVLLAGCKGKDPFKDPVRVNREAGIEDIEFSEDGRRFCFIDAKANVGVVDVRSGQLLWSRSIVADDRRRWSARTWAACELLNDAGDVVTWHDDVNIGQVSIVPADPDEPIMAFDITDGWSDSDYARLTKAFVENRDALDLSGIGGDSEADRQALRRDLDRFCQMLVSEPKLWFAPWWFLGYEEDPCESDLAVLRELGRAAERAARELVFRDRALASQLAKARPGTASTSLGIVDIHGQKGVLAGSIRGDTMLSVYSPQDGHLMWWFAGPWDFEFDELQPFLEKILPPEEHEKMLAIWPEMRLWVPKLHRYIDRGTIDVPMAPTTEWGGPSSSPNWLRTGRKNGRTYLYLGEVNSPGYNFLSVGMLENDIDVEWRTLETYGVRKFAADGFQVLVLYAKGRIALWDISEEGGGDPKLLAEGQAVESKIWHEPGEWVEDGTAVAYRDGCGLVGVNEQYWVIRKNKVKGPFKAEGKITAAAVRPPYWVYGTADGKIIFGRLD